MASILKVKGNWRAQVRRRGHPPQTKTFPTKILAQQWARQVETDIDAGRAAPAKVSAVTVSQLVTRYTNEVGESKPFGRNKADVLKRIQALLGEEPAATLTAERVVDYIRRDRAISGVTAAIDLTYLKGVLKIAKALWREPVQPAVVDDAREILKYLGMLGRSTERDRRPTPDELNKLRWWFRRSESLTVDTFDFILASCFRPPSEVVRLRWEDLNHDDRTIVIHDRKDPRKKIGNHQTVPLLGEAFDIVMRQPRRDARIFPVNGNSWSSLFPRACKDLGMKLYDLRHHAISCLVESGNLSIPEICLVTGHKDWRMLSRYTHLKAASLHLKYGNQRTEAPED